jgi:hypothetical protein
MAYVAGHLSVAALEERYEACEDVTSSRHFQTIWLLAKGHSTGEVVKRLDILTPRNLISSAV